MYKLIKDLFLAMINATLILIALCLVLALTVVNRANAITETFATNLIKLEPLRDEASQVRQDIATIRSDIADLKAKPNAFGEAALSQLGTRVDVLSDSLNEMEHSIQEVKQMPYDLTDHAITTAAETVAQVLAPLVFMRSDQ